MTLQGKKIAFLTATEGIEQVELTEPWQAVQEAGAQPVLLTPGGEKAQAFHHLDRGAVFEADGDVRTADPADYVAVVLPGGVANPDQLRAEEKAVSFVRRAADAGLPVAAICHGPWTLIEADVVRGRRVTSWPSLRTDLANAGAEWVDEEVVVDTSGAGPLITSRNPDDLPAFNKALLEQLGS